MSHVASGLVSPADRDRLSAICARFSIRRLALFGSQLSGTSARESDVDLLVEFDPGSSPTYLDMAEAEIALSPLFGGKRIDLRTADELSRYFRDRVVREAREQYVAG